MVRDEENPKEEEEEEGGGEEEIDSRPGKQKEKESNF